METRRGLESNLVPTIALISLQGAKNVCRDWVRLKTIAFFYHFC